MFTKIKEFLFGKPTQTEVETKAEVPYKVEAPAEVGKPADDRVEEPAPAKCGCGRSASGLCVGLHKLTENEWANHPDNRASVPVAVAAPKKAPVKKQQFEKKAVVAKPPVATKAPPKPRTPRKPVAK